MRDPRIMLFAPLGLDETTHPTQLPLDRAAVLKNCLTGAPHGRLIRGKGQAATRDIPPQTSNVLRAFVTNQRNCGKFLLDYSAGGTLRLVMGDYNRAITLPDCAGPLPDYGDLDEGGVYVPANQSGGAVILEGATPGRYLITAQGYWSQDLDIDTYLVDARGNFNFVTIPSGVFSGLRFGAFAAQDPGTGNWTYIGTEGILTVTGSGDIYGAFVDEAIAYGDNVGSMAVHVRALK